MRLNSNLTPAQQALGIAATGLALINPVSADAEAKPIEGVRLAQSAMAATSGDSYQDGRALLASGDIPGAIAAFRATLLATPQSIDALNGLGVAYDRIGRYDISRSYYDNALAIDPGAVLVLNNLGYSLYLQGAYEAAIPLLQQVVASNDDAARRAGQRVLTMIAARMRADAIEGRAPRSATVGTMVARSAASKDTALPAAVYVEAPLARIEISSSGEQRLVLGAPGPDEALAAKLGDAAPLVLVASEWTSRDEAALATRQAAADRAAEKATRATMAEALTAALVAARQPATRNAAPTMPPAAALAAVPALARRRETAPALDTEDRAGTLAPQTALALATALSSALSVQIAATADNIERAIDDAAQRAAAGGTRRATARVDAADLAAAAELAGGMTSYDSAPAWLLASRRVSRSAEANDIIGDQPDGDASAAFDSDDDDLNAFAARMRGIDPVADIGPVPIEVAVARLEALLRRLRAA